MECIIECRAVHQLLSGWQLTHSLVGWTASQWSTLWTQDGGRTGVSTRCFPKIASVAGAKEMMQNLGAFFPVELLVYTCIWALHAGLFQNKPPSPHSHEVSGMALHLQKFTLFGEFCFYCCFLLQKQSTGVEKSDVSQVLVDVVYQCYQK